MASLRIIARNVLPSSRTLGSFARFYATSPHMSGSETNSKAKATVDPKKGSGEWKEELASTSEATIRGEKTNMPIEEMQKQTVEKVSKK